MKRMRLTISARRLVTRGVACTRAGYETCFTGKRTCVVGARGVTCCWRACRFAGKCITRGIARFAGFRRAGLPTRPHVCFTRIWAGLYTGFRACIACFSRCCYRQFCLTAATQNITVHSGFTLSSVGEAGFFCG
jgi:hypothetical protein